MSPVSKDFLETLEPLLDHALGLRAEELAPWLERLRAERPGVARELEKLLAEEGTLDSKQFLEGDGWTGLLDVSGTLTGHQLGAYTLEALLGRGGMGSVWQARRSDGRYEGKAAVKLLNLSLLDPVGRERFRREGTALARLTHPNIAHLIDAGVAPDGQPYLVLEYVEGRRIDTHCDEHRLTSRTRIDLFLQVCSAVGHAHANLIIHRDLKPSNILVTPDGAVKLLDFGIAKLLEAETTAAERSVLTDLGGLAMTPEYAAPEQVAGDPVTTATDVYSLGVLLYVLLAGRHPTGEGSRSAAEHIRGILDTEPPPLSSVVGNARAGDATNASDRAIARGSTVEGLRRSYRGDLDIIVATALKKDPTQRYLTVTALADDLRRYVRHEPITARGDSFGYRARKFARRNRASLLVGALIAATLVAATAVTTEQMLEARKQRDQAVFHARRAEAQFEFQTLLLSSLGEKPLTPHEIVDRGQVLLEQEWIGEPRFASSITLHLSSLYYELGDNAKAAKLLTRAESLAIAGHAVDMLVPVRCARVVNLHLRDSTRRALALLDETRPLFTRADRRDVAGCLEAEATIAYLTGRADTAVILGRRAVALLDSLGATTGQGYMTVLNTLANALENAGHGREAITTYQRIAGVLARSGRRESIMHNATTNNIGIALSNLGEMRAAEPILRLTVREFQRTNSTGFVHPAILINYNRTLLFLNQLDSAATWYERMVSQAESQSDLEMQHSGHYGLAQVEVMRGHLPEAARHAALATRVGAKMAKPQTADDLTLVGMLANARGDPASGLTSLEGALRERGYYQGKRTYQMRAKLILAAEAALALGNSRKTLEYAGAARRLADVDSLTATRSAYVGEAALLEARALLHAGDTAAARNRARAAATALTYGAGANHPRAREAAGLLSRLRSP